ncbi:MAG TPA: YeeE/YedE thiosulfate transporter family protein [Nannocystis sp.]
MSLSSVLPPLLGGVLIGVSALLLLALCGRIAGVSGILGRIFDPGRGDDRSWRLAFVLGLGLGGAALLFLAPHVLPRALPGSPLLVGLAGFLVGLGTRAAGGCTSGHGVCGLGRRSRRSLVAVAVFMVTGVLTALFVRPHLLGGGL